MRAVLAPMFVIHEGKALRVIKDQETGIEKYQRYDPKNRTFVDDFEYVFDAMSGFDPFAQPRGTEYALINEEVTEEQFYAFLKTL